MIPDIATRVYNHTFRIDPIVRTLLDTDFYKLLMLQMIWKLHGERQVTFQLINRTTEVRLADIVDERELIDQLDHARTLRLAKNELIWLAGNTFYGTKQIFEPAFMEWLSDFRLPEYELTRRDGQYELRFAGPWAGTTMWEIPALAIINELRARAAMRAMSRFDLDVLYARAKAKLWSKVERLRVLAAEGPLKVSDFGTRRRHGFLWQRWCVEALQEGLGDNFIGTSNVKHAMDTGLEAIGTNAHELPMVYAALADDDDAVRDAPYDVLRDWARMYGGNLLVVLPDCFGTTSFLERAPDWVADWKGARPDSKEPIAGAEELIAWWKRRGRDPQEKLMVLSDAMDIDTIESSVRALRGQINLSIGWGTNLTNDFKGCASGRSRRRIAGDFAGVQSGRGRRASRRQTFRQSQQGAGDARGDRALPAHLRRSGHDETPGAGVGRRAPSSGRDDVLPRDPAKRSGLAHLVAAYRVVRRTDEGDMLGRGGLRLGRVAREYGLADACVLLEQRVAHAGTAVEAFPAEKHALAQQISEHAHDMQHDDVVRRLVNGDVQAHVRLRFVGRVGHFVHPLHFLEAFANRAAIGLGRTASR